MYTKPDLLTPARALSKALTTPSTTPTTTLLSHFTRDPYPTAHEHGLPGLAPFLGRTFTGVDGVGRYFQLLGKYLGVEDMRFEDEALWVVDVEAMAVVMRGEARFWARSGRGQGQGGDLPQAWDETFVYRLGMAVDVHDDDGLGTGTGGTGGTLKVQEYLVWADTGAAYLSLHNRLGEVQGPESETRKSLDRKRSGCGGVIGSGMNAYGSCG